MDSLDKISSDTTVIMIAHRLSTLKNCTKTINIENGVILDKSKYNDNSS